MLVYLTVFILLLFLIYKFDVKGRERDRRKWELYVIIFLILIVGLRNHVGSDSIVYEWEFNTSATPLLSDFFKHWTDYHPVLWEFVMSFCKTVFGTFVAVQFFHAIVFNLLVLRFVRKTTKYTFTALLIVFCTIWFANSFEVLRESIGAALYLNGILFLTEKKYTKYVISAVIAFGFHTFSIFIFVLTPLLMLISSRWMWFTFGISIVVITLFDLSYISQLLTYMSGFMSGEDAEKILNYLAQQNQGRGSILGYLRKYLIDFFLPILVVILSKDNKPLFKNLIILWLVFSALTIEIPILYRLDNYLYVVYAVALTNLLYHYDRRKDLLLYGVIFFLAVMSCLMRMVDTYRPGPTEYRKNVNYDCRYFPYKSIFQESDPIRESVDWY